MSEVEKRLELIEGRNGRVEADKAWETSWTRRISIALITYVCALILLNILNHDESWKHAFVPVVGYLLSTLSLPMLKSVWVKRYCKYMRSE